MVNLRDFFEGVLDRGRVRITGYPQLVIEGFDPRHFDHYKQQFSLSNEGQPRPAALRQQGCRKLRSEKSRVREKPPATSRWAAVGGHWTESIPSLPWTAERQDRENSASDSIRDRRGNSECRGDENRGKRVRQDMTENHSEIGRAQRARRDVHIPATSFSRNSPRVSRATVGQFVIPITTMMLKML